MSIDDMFKKEEKKLRKLFDTKLLSELLLLNYQYSNNEKLILTTAIIIFVVMLIYTISKVIGGPFSDFCKEAITWVLGGIALAFAMAYLNSKNK